MICIICVLCIKCPFCRCLWPPSYMSPCRASFTKHCKHNVNAELNSSVITIIIPNLMWKLMQNIFWTIFDCCITSILLEEYFYLECSAYLCFFFFFLYMLIVYYVSYLASFFESCTYSMNRRIKMIGIVIYTVDIQWLYFKSYLIFHIWNGLLVTICFCCSNLM